ncbi:hypothetical protein KDA14_05135 [Candidatus Saccharibacteria bacterium]|nr:hypothetical protein [Candidatus Saccharibacteria bacterium]
MVTPVADPVLPPPASTPTQAPTYGTAIRKTTRAELDAGRTGWRADAATSLVKNYVPDPILRKRFWVHPPNDGTGMVAAIVAFQPNAITLAGVDLTNPATFDVDLPVDECFAPALIYYILHRAWRKDADYAGKPEVAQVYYDLFLSALGVTKK